MNFALDVGSTCLMKSASGDPFLERPTLEDVLDVHDARLGALPFDGDRPRRRLHARGLQGWIRLVGTELDEIVVGGDVSPGVQLLGRAERALPDVLQLASVRSRLLRLQC